MQHVTKRIYLIYDRNARNGTSLHGNGQAERTGKKFDKKTQELAYIAVLFCHPWRLAGQTFM